MAACLPVGVLACSSPTKKADTACHVFGPVRDHLSTTVGQARTWGLHGPGDSVYGPYSRSDRVTLCLLPDGRVMGIFDKDGKRKLLWVQTASDHFIFPI